MERHEQPRCYKCGVWLSPTTGVVMGKLAEGEELRPPKFAEDGKGGVFAAECTDGNYVFLCHACMPQNAKIVKGLQ